MKRQQIDHMAQTTIKIKLPLKVFCVMFLWQHHIFNDVHKLACRKLSQLSLH